MTDPVLEALREIVPVTRGQVNLGGRMLRWVESGTGPPTVVLIAGRNDTALLWGPVLAALAGRVCAAVRARARRPPRCRGGQRPRRAPGPPGPGGRGHPRLRPQ
jgi:hypothetical protein